MYYKEWLRVRGLFIKFAIVTASLVALVLLLSAPPGALTVDTGGARYQLGSHNSHDTTNVVAPGIEAHDVTHGAPIGFLFSLAGFAASIFAMILGTFLSCENHGHLDVAWTRPASRTGYAIRAIGIDFAAAFAAFAFTLLIIAVLVTLRGWWPYLRVDQGLGWTAARFAMYPFAWYALISAITASMRTGANIAVGLTWVVNSVLLVLKTFHLPASLNAVVAFVGYLNPMTYGSWSDNTQANAVTHLVVNTPIAALGGLLGITVLGLGAALLQWRRLEA